jgi:integrase
MATIRKRTWFTAAELEKIRPEAERLAKAAGRNDKDGWLGYRDKAAAALEIKQHEAWLVAYVDKGKRRFKNFETKTAAKQWSINALHEVQRGIHTPASVSKTVSEAWELWLADCEGAGRDEPLERGTIEQRRQHLRLHVAPFIGEVKLAELTAPSVNEFMRQLKKEGRSFSMRRKVLTNLKTMLSFAQGHAQGMVSQNVARSIRLKKETRAEATGPLRAGVDFPAMSELNLLIEKSAGRWRPLIITAIFTGMRASELRGLPWRDVALDKGVIHVRQRADKWGKLGATKSKTGKRDIPLPPIVVNALRQWRTGCPKGELDLVFPNGRGRVETLTNIYKRCWQPLQVKCGLVVDSGAKDKDAQPIIEPRYGFHMLRHAAASLFIQYLGWTPKRLQTVMGHSSINMTFDLYGHLFENVEKDRDDMAKIEAAVRAA